MCKDEQSKSGDKNNKPGSKATSYIGNGTTAHNSNNNGDKSPLVKNNLLLNGEETNVLLKLTEGTDSNSK